MSGIISSESFHLETEIAYPSEWNGTVVIDLDGGTNSSSGETVLRPALSRNRNRAVTYSEKKDLPPDSWQRSPVYFYGYNDSNFARNVHEIVASVRMAREHPDWEVNNIHLVGTGSNAALAFAAHFVLGDEIDEVNADPANFSFSQISDLWDDAMVPGAVKYGGLEGLRSLTREAGP
ncbi:MAG: hypothetical protein AAGC68_15015 [Verrucomicrobiota bacterium]